jgi:hypothetical protein
MSIAVGLLVDVAGLSSNLRVFDPLGAPLAMAPRVFGSRGDEGSEVATWLVASSCVGWTLAGTAVVFGRYRKLAAV